MPARSTSSTTLSFGLVSIPVKLYTATSAQDVHFNQLHAKCGSRLKQRLYCPVDDEYVERGDIVKGYEIAKNQYVRFSEEELRALSAERFQTLDLVEFVPESTVDLLYIERSQYVGPDKGGDKAFNLLTKAMRRMQRIAVGRYWSRGKVQLVLLRPYDKGLVLHQVYYGNEVRSYAEVELGPDHAFSEAEEQLAERLIEQLSSPAFAPEKYHDEYAERVRKAAEDKAKGQEITVVAEAPAAQIIDLFEALKQSLSATSKPQGPREPKKASPERQVAASAEKPASDAPTARGRAALKGPRKATDKPGRASKRKLG